MTEQTLNVVTVSLDTLQNKDAKIATLNSTIKALEVQNEVLADKLKDAAANAGEIIVRTDSCWSGTKVVGTKNLENVKADITNTIREEFKAVIEDKENNIKSLHNAIAENNSTIKDLRKEIREVETSYEKRLKAIQEENDLVRRANKLEVETEKIRLNEDFSSKVKGYKDTIKDLKSDIADLEDQLDKERTNKTNRELEKVINEQIELLTAEVEYLRKSSPLKAYIYGMISKIKSWDAWKLRSAINRRY